MSVIHKSQLLKVCEIVMIAYDLGVILIPYLLGTVWCKLKNYTEYSVSTFSKIFSARFFPSFEEQKDVNNYFWRWRNTLLDHKTSWQIPGRANLMVLEHSKTMQH
jgi:hypothetical protein